jgi:Na+-translocating ferredoxin:NAD+ oxidoreductase RnfG subunit
MTITLIATTILVVLNAVLPGFKLKLSDTEKALLHEIMQAEDFVIYNDFDINNFNDNNGANSNNELKMVIRAKGGQDDGLFALRMSTQGYGNNPKLDYAVAFSSNSSVLGMRIFNANETSPYGNAYDRENFYDAFVGQVENITANNIKNLIGTGASATVDAFVKGVALAAKAAVLLNKTPAVWSDASAGETELLQKLVQDSTALFTKGNAAILSENGILDANKSQNLINVYVQRTGSGANQTTIIESIGDGGNFGEVRLMTIFNQADGLPIIRILKSYASGTYVNGDGSQPGNIEYQVPPEKLFDYLIEQSLQMTRSQIFDDNNGFFDINSGATQENGPGGTQNATHGFLYSLRNAFLIHESLDYAKLIEIVSNQKLPVPSWGVVTAFERDILRNMMSDSTLEFIKANDMLLQYYDVLTQSQPNLLNIFVSNKSDIVLQVQSNADTKPALMVSIVQDTVSSVALSASFEDTYFGGNEREQNSNTKLLNVALKQSFEGLKSSEITDAEFDFAIPFFDTIKSEIQSNVKQALDNAFKIRAILQNVTQFVQNATDINWGTILPETLVKLRELLGKDSNDQVSQSQFKAAGLKMLVKVNAINQQQADALQPYLVNVFVALDGSGKVIVEAEFNSNDYSGNSPSGNGNHGNGHVSVLILFDGSKDNRFIASVDLGTITYVTPSFQTMMNTFVKYILPGLTLRQMNISFGDGWYKPGDGAWGVDENGDLLTSSGGTYGTNGALNATKKAFEIDSVLDVANLISAARQMV